MKNNSNSFDHNQLNNRWH